MSAEILVVDCGLVPYEEALVAQRWLVEARQEGAVPDVLLLLEHPPVYTRGRRSDAAELPMPAEWYEAQGIAVLDTDRGGRVTYHGPGQLVAYPIVSLAPYGDDVHEYVRRLERVAISALSQNGVEAGTIEGLTGVWVGRRAAESPISPHSGPSAGGAAAGAAGTDGASEAGADGAAKIGSIGVHVRRGVTAHGIAINVNNDLQPFEWIVPCGIEGCQVTSLSRELGADRDLAAFGADLTERYGEVFERSPVATEPAALGLDSARLGVR